MQIFCLFRELVVHFRNIEKIDIKTSGERLNTVKNMHDFSRWDLKERMFRTYDNK